MLEAYDYDVQMRWVSGRSGRAAAEGLSHLSISAPPEFSGERGLWTPEHLLVAATASCLMTTFLAIAELSKLHVIAYESTARGHLEKMPQEGYRFTEIVITPQIEVAEEDRGKVAKVLAKAEKNCFISNSLRTKVRVEAQFLVGAAPQV